MPLVASNTHILIPLFRPLWKILDDSKGFLPAMSMIMSLKVLKYFSSSRISVFLFTSLWFKKMDKNSRPRTKLDTITISIFWIYNVSSLCIRKFAAYHKSQHQCDLRSKKIILFFQQLQFYSKNEIFGKIWIVDTGCLWFN